MNDLEILAHAIARIGELDVTRTLPGRLVWYAPRGCFVRFRVTSAGPSLPANVVAVWEKPGFGDGWLGRHADGRIVDLVRDENGHFLPGPEWSKFGEALLTPDPPPTPCQGCRRPRYSTDATGRCFTCRAVANGYVPRSAQPTAPNCLCPRPPAGAPPDPTRQGGLDAWSRS